MNSMPSYAWWIIGALTLLVSVLCVLWNHLRIALHLSRKREREAQEGSDRLLRSLHEVRGRAAHGDTERASLQKKLATILHAVVLLPLPPDLRSCYETGITYLPRVSYKGEGRVEVMIPGIYKYAYTIHIDPEAQTNEERERIYGALRNSKEARAELGIGIA